MTVRCSVCRFHPAFPGFDLCSRCLDYALEEDAAEVMRVPTSQLVFSFTGQPLFGPLEVVEAAERYL
jgi:hypothetical protein